MKLNFECVLFKFEADFDKDDAKVFIPTILLIISIFFTDFSEEIPIIICVLYYMTYLFFKPVTNDLINLLGKFRKWLLYKCPHCKSRKITLQGHYSSFSNDDEMSFNSELHACYRCTNCKKNSVLTVDGLADY